MLCPINAKKKPKNGLYFVAYEHKTSDGDVFFNFLRKWSNSEDYSWSEPTPCFDLQTYLESLLEKKGFRHINAHDLDVPCFFSSYEDARLAIKTIKVLEHHHYYSWAAELNYECYHIVFSKTQHVPIKILGVDSMA